MQLLPLLLHLVASATWCGRSLVAAGVRESRWLVAQSRCLRGTSIGSKSGSSGFL